MAQRLILANEPQPTPARFGLLDAARVVDSTDPHEGGGVAFEVDPLVEARTYLWTCPPPADPSKAVETGSGLAGADPVTVYAGWGCSPAGYTMEEIERRARVALVNGEGRAIEATFWTGEADDGDPSVVWPHLAAEDADADAASTADGAVTFLGADVLNGGVALPLGLALAALEGALGDCYPGRPTIHMTRVAASALGARLLPEGGNLVTRLGSIVAAGAGYPGSAPDGTPAAAGETWLYGTGQVTVRRSAPQLLGDFSSSFDRAANSVVRILERTYVVSWDRCLIAVRATLEAL
jgi:hypothetical protein